MKLVQKRSKQLYEMDVVLFDKIDLPVLIPEDIIESQKALSKKPKKMTRAERGAAAAAAAAAAAQA